MPVSTRQREELKRPIKEKFGISGRPAARIDACFGAYTSPDLIKRAHAMLCIFNVLKGASKDRWHKNLYQMYFESETLRYLLRPDGYNTDNSNQEDYTDELNDGTNSTLMSVVNMFGKHLHPIAKDGNCLFNAVAYCISRTINNEHEGSAIKNHFESMNLRCNLTTEEMAALLRSSTVDELLKNKNEYCAFLENVQARETTYEETVNKFRKSGVFAGDVGDLMVKALANVINYPIVLFTSIKSYPVITVAPNVFAENGDTGYAVFVAFTREGPGHYDAVVEKERLATKNTSSGILQKPCTCGINSKQNRKSCCHTTNPSGRTYSSRCPCLNSKKQCIPACKCKGCYNPHGAKPLALTSKSKNRKRNASQLGGERKSGVKFLLEHDETLVGGKWTEEENFVLMEHVRETPEILTSNTSCESINHLVNKYNNSATEAAKFGLNHVRQKEKKQIESKLAHLKSNFIYSRGANHGFYETVEKTLST